MKTNRPTNEQIMAARAKAVAEIESLDPIGFARRLLRRTELPGSPMNRRAGPGWTRSSAKSITKFA